MTQVQIGSPIVRPTTEWIDFLHRPAGTKPCSYGGNPILSRGIALVFVIGFEFFSILLNNAFLFNVWEWEAIEKREQLKCLDMGYMHEE